MASGIRLPLAPYYRATTGSYSLGRFGVLRAAGASSLEFDPSSGLAQPFEFAPASLPYRHYPERTLRSVSKRMAVRRSCEPSRRLSSPFTPRPYTLSRILRHVEWAAQLPARADEPPVLWPAAPNCSASRRLHRAPSGFAVSRGSRRAAVRQALGAARSSA